MSDQPVADLLGGGDAPPANPFGSVANGSDAKTGTSHATPNGADGYSFAPPPETPPAPSLSEAPETPSEKLSRGFNKLGGALGGLGASVGRGIQTASSRATSAVARTSERIDAVGGGATSCSNGNAGDAGNAGAASGGSNGGERKGPMMNIAMQRTLSGVGASSPSSSAGSSVSKKQQTAQTHSAPNSGNSTSSGGGFSLGSSLAALTTTVADGLSSTTTALSQSLTTSLTRQYTMPDRTVASQVLMYRQLLHTECKPGLRLSRAFQGTPAQRAVMHMPVSAPCFFLK